MTCKNPNQLPRSGRSVVAVALELKSPAVVKFNSKTQILFSLQKSFSLFQKFSFLFKKNIFQTTKKGRATVSFPQFKTPKLNKSQFLGYFLCLKIIISLLNTDIEVFYLILWYFVSMNKVKQHFNPISILIVRAKSMQMLLSFIIFMYMFIVRRRYDTSCE